MMIIFVIKKMRIVKKKMITRLKCNHLFNYYLVFGNLIILHLLWPIGSSWLEEWYLDNNLSAEVVLTLLYKKSLLLIASEIFSIETLSFPLNNANANAFSNIVKDSNTATIVN